jgi:hypothetical protein
MIVTRSSSDVQRKMNPPREPGRFVWMTGYIYAGAINVPENREQLRAGKRKPRARARSRPA